MGRRYDIRCVLREAELVLLNGIMTLELMVMTVIERIRAVLHKVVLT